MTNLNKISEIFSGAIFFDGVGRVFVLETEGYFAPLSSFDPVNTEGEAVEWKRKYINTADTDLEMDLLPSEVKSQKEYINSLTEREKDILRGLLSL